MALLDLKTNLKSLKYGSDTPGGGNSGQPYQQVDINTADSGFNRFRMTKFDDGLVRGGVVGAANASIVDTFRIGKFLKDFPKGPLFIVKQVGLQLSNPQIEHKTNFPTNRPTREQGLLRNVGNFISNTANKVLNAVGPTRIYNLGINTLAQVPVNAFGQHIVRHGFTPRRDNDNLYFKVALYNNNEGNNRLSQLRSILGNPTANISTYISGPGSVYGIGNTTIRRRGDFIDINRDTTVTEWATSGSFVLSREKQLNSFISASNEIRNRKFLGLSYKFMSSLSENKFEDDGEAIVRKEENQPVSLYDNDWADYKDKNKEAIAYSNASSKMRDEPNSFTGVSQYSSSVFSITRFDNLTSTTGDLYKPQTLNNYTASNADTSSINTIGKWDGKLTASVDLGLSNLSTPLDIPRDIDAIDKSLDQNVINYSNPLIKKYSELRNVITSTNNAYKDLNTKTVGVDRQQADIVLKNKKGIEITNELKNKFVRTNDIYPFEDTMALKFVPLDPFTGQPLDLTLNFLGYLNEFTENYNSNWGDVKYTGRSEKFYIFNDFTREVNVGFNIPCFHPDELEAKHCQLSGLASTLAGKYNDNGLLGGIITRLKLGNYVNDQPGIIKNLTFSPIQDSSWDLDKKLAFYIKVNFGFTVIHNFLPQYYPCGFIFKEPDPVPQTKPPREEPPPPEIPPVTSSLVPDPILPTFIDSTNYRFSGRAGEFQGQRGKTPPLTEKDIRPFTQAQDDALRNFLNKASRN
jgi:hypothetical protein